MYAATTRASGSRAEYHQPLATASTSVRRSGSRSRVCVREGAHDSDESVVRYASDTLRSRQCRWPACRVDDEISLHPFAASGAGEVDAPRRRCTRLTRDDARTTPHARARLLRRDRQSLVQLTPIDVPSVPVGIADEVGFVRRVLTPHGNSRR